MKIKFNEVTTFSKLLALVIFITFPFIGFYLGNYFGYQTGYMDGSMYKANNQTDNFTTPQPSIFHTNTPVSIEPSFSDESISKIYFGTTNQTNKPAFLIFSKTYVGYDEGGKTDAKYGFLTGIGGGGYSNKTVNDLLNSKLVATVNNDLQVLNIIQSLSNSDIYYFIVFTPDVHGLYLLDTNKNIFELLWKSDSDTFGDTGITDFQNITKKYLVMGVDDCIECTPTKTIGSVIFNLETRKSISLAMADAIVLQEEKGIFTYRKYDENNVLSEKIFTEVLP